MNLPSFKQKPDDLPLRSRQPGNVVDEEQQALLAFLKSCILLHHRLLDLSLHDRMPLQGTADMIKNLFIGASLYNIIQCSGAHGSDDDLPQFMGCQKNNLCLRIFVTDHFGSGDSRIHGLHLNIHQDQVIIHIFR